MKKSLNSAQKLTFLALSVAVAMIFSYVEMLLPSLSHIAPGIKIGLPNIVIISVLYLFGTKEAATVSIIRVILTSLLFTSPLTGAYGLAGAVLSLFVMALLKLTGRFSMIFVSIIGAIMHNVAQVILFFLISQTAAVISYLPFLIIGGVLSGLAVGLCAYFLYKRLQKVYRI